MIWPPYYELHRYLSNEIKKEQPKFRETLPITCGTELVMKIQRRKTNVYLVYRNTRIQYPPYTHLACSNNISF
jgi:hypothetical protein